MPEKRDDSASWMYRLTMGVKGGLTDFLPRKDTPRLNRKRLRALQRTIDEYIQVPGGVLRQRWQRRWREGGARCPRRPHVAPRRS